MRKFLYSPAVLKLAGAAAAVAAVAAVHLHT